MHAYKISMQFLSENQNTLPFFLFLSLHTKSNLLTHPTQYITHSINFKSAAIKISPYFSPTLNNNYNVLTNVKIALKPRAHFIRSTNKMHKLNLRPLIATFLLLDFQEDFRKQFSIVWRNTVRNPGGTSRIRAQIQLERNVGWSWDIARELRRASGYRVIALTLVRSIDRLYTVW